MLQLSQDILEHNVFPLLGLEAIVSLRCVCKYLYAIIEASDRWKWDRRYYMDFPFDARKLDGHGFARYNRRSRARIEFHESDDYVRGSISQNETLLETICSEPIVDLAFFYCIPKDWLEHSWNRNTDGILVRRLDNSLVAYTGQGCRAVIETADISGMRYVDFGVGNYLLGWKDGQLVNFDLADLAMPLLKNQNEPLRKTSDGPRVLTISSLDVNLQNSDAGIFYETEKLSAAHARTRLVELPLTLAFYSAKLNLVHDVWDTKSSLVGEDVYQCKGFNHFVREFVKQFPVEFDLVIATDESFDEPGNFLAASKGNTLYIMRETSSLPKKKFTLTFPRNILHLSSGCRNYGERRYDVFALDDGGNVYRGYSFRLRDAVDVTEPELLVENVAQLMGSDAMCYFNRVLIEDGTVKSMEQSPPVDTGVKNVVMISAPLYLCVD